MRINNPSKEQLRQYFHNLDAHIVSLPGSTGEPFWIKYLDLGVKVVRLINYSPEFTPHVEKQLTYILKDVTPIKVEQNSNAVHFDATLVIWKEPDMAAIPAKLSDELNPKKNLRLRIDELVRGKKKTPSLRIFNGVKNVFSSNPENGILSAYNSENNTYYYAAENLEPEEFIKQGHLLVRILNKITKTPSTGLVHGAAVGINNKGILICARGQRGKSTLAVLAMMQGFEYVSDDYLTLEKTDDGLFAHPIYSIITLSPRMYNELYDDLNGKFVSNNSRKDKYVINVEPYHDTFRERYPISVCLFPEIVSDLEPSIVLCNNREKGRAIVQLVHSTIIQTGDRNDIRTVKKLLDFVKDFEFYRLNLSANIHANVRVLGDFIQQYEKQEGKQK